MDAGFLLFLARKPPWAGQASNPLPNLREQRYGLAPAPALEGNCCGFCDSECGEVTRFGGNPILHRTRRLGSDDCCQMGTSGCTSESTKTQDIYGHLTQWLTVAMSLPLMVHRPCSRSVQAPTVQAPEPVPWPFACRACYSAGTNHPRITKSLPSHEVIVGLLWASLLSFQRASNLGGKLPQKNHAGTKALERANLDQGEQLGKRNCR